MQVGCKLNSVVRRAILKFLSLEVRKPNGDEVTLFISFVGVKGDALAERLVCIVMTSRTTLQIHMI